MKYRAEHGAGESPPGRPPRGGPVSRRRYRERGWLPADSGGTSILSSHPPFFPEKRLFLCQARGLPAIIWPCSRYRLYQRAAGTVLTAARAGCGRGLASAPPPQEGRKQHPGSAAFGCGRACSRFFKRLLILLFLFVGLLVVFSFSM